MEKEERVRGSGGMHLEIDDLFLRDARIDYLAVVTGEIKQTSRGRLLDLYLDSINRLQDVRTEEEIDQLCAWFNPGRGSYAEAMVQAKLAERLDNGQYRIKGVRERMEWLRKLKETRRGAGLKGSKKRWENPPQRNERGQFDPEPDKGAPIANAIPDIANAIQKMAKPWQNIAKPCFTLTHTHTLTGTKEKEEGKEISAEVEKPPPAPVTVSEIQVLPEFQKEPKAAALFKARGVKSVTQQLWLETYPDADWLCREVVKAINWVTINPKKTPKKWAQFLNNWFDRGWEKYRKTIPSVGPGAFDEPSRKPKTMDDLIREEAEASDE